MKETLYTIPLNDAVNAGDECPFCFIEREVEQDLMDFVLGSGSSYMKPPTRQAFADSISKRCSTMAIPWETAGY